ncbi:MAG TPA: hypothetical protein VM511_13135, partial [Luteolibacter sp.]|nr:hypothetical protein [Luteolibacter sp.]
MKIAGLLLLAGAGLLLSMLPKQDGPFRYESLKGRSDEEIDLFMGGRTARDSFQKDDPTPNSFPENHWMKDPHEAAIAFVQANRNVSGKPRQERENPQTPESGWIVYDWTSSGCYSLSTSVTAIRFGVDRPFIFHSETNTNGVVGRNPFADRIGRKLDIIEISPGEARFISDFVFRIDDFRSRREEDRFSFGSISSTADGSGVIDLHPAGRQPMRINGRVWAGRSIHDS